MSIPAREAADALENIERAQRRSVSAFHDQMASPHLILWGGIWMIGYSVSYLWTRGHLVWFALAPAGFVASWWIGRRRFKAKPRSFAWQYPSTLLAVFLFVEGLFAIMPPKSGLQVAAFFPLLIALWYLLQGIWTRAIRICALGLALGVLAVCGYLWLEPYFLLWMAGVGGGALVLGGLWMRGV